MVVMLVLLEDVVLVLVVVLVLLLVVLDVVARCWYLATPLAKKLRTLACE